jgi:hypothetical protein
MVTDTWACGCLYVWTRDAGWVHGYDCFDGKLRALLS